MSFLLQGPSITFLGSSSTVQWSLLMVVASWRLSSERGNVGPSSYRVDDGGLSGMPLRRETLDPQVILSDMTVDSKR